MKIEKDKMVSIHYTLTDDKGVQIDSSVGGEPLSYIHGNGYLIVGMEKALEGKEPGAKFDITIQPEEGYGTYDERLVANLPKDRFEVPGEIEIGMQFQVMTGSGPMIVKVIEVNGDTVKIDGNHDLAGKVLNFSVEVIDVRDLTEEELTQLSSGGCGCGGGCGGCGGDCGGNCGGDCGGNCGEGCGSGECNCNS